MDILNIGKNTAYALVNSGVFHFVKVGGHYRISKKSFNHWLDNTKEYICDNDWTVREITPSEGYLLDTTVHKVGAEPQLYTVEHNQTANDVTEQVVKGNIAIIKHTDNGETQIETPESGAEFAVYLKAAGSYEVAEDTERDYLTCDENGFAQTKDMPYGIYTVHQVSGWEGSELMPDFDVFISQNGATYRCLINNAPFNSFIKIVKQDAETGKTIPYAGAGFKIYDPDGNPVTMTFTYPTPTTIDVFYTNAEGSLVTPEKLSFGKGYSIVEVQAPYGYVLDETPVYFDVTEDNSTEESGVIGMLVVLDSILNRITQNRAKGKNTYIFIDEIYLLFQHEYSANFLFTLWKRVRKYGAFATGITQNVDDLLQSHTARTMLANSEFIIMLKPFLLSKKEVYNGRYKDKRYFYALIYRIVRPVTIRFPEPVLTMAPRTASTVVGLTSGRLLQISVLESGVRLFRTVASTRAFSVIFFHIPQQTTTRIIRIYFFEIYAD